MTLSAEESWKSPRLFLHQFLIKTHKHTFQGITLSIVRTRSLALSDKLKKILFTAFTISVLAFSGLSRIALATPTTTSQPSLVRPLNQVVLLDPTFNPQTVGGVTFCASGPLGTVICYPPNCLKTAYDFPAAKVNEEDNSKDAEEGNGDNSGLPGSGSTMVIVDAFGSPTIQSDLDKFDTAFGISQAQVTVLCPPTWTGSSTDNCPVKTIADLSTAPNAAVCGAFGWAAETTLDVTISHGLAPGAKIVLVVSADCQDTSINSAEAAVVSQDKYRGSIMSQSFGEPDDLVGCTAVDPVTLQCTATDPTVKANADAIYKLAKERQWTVIASSGDDGANTDARFLGTTELTPSWPSTNPLNLAVGGTQGQPYGGQFGLFPGPGKTLTCAAHKQCNTGLVVINGGESGCKTAARPGVPSSCFPVGYGSEGAWNEFTAFGGSVGRVTGGGVSSLYERPSYQKHLSDSFSTILGSSVKADGRLTPDVSFNAAAQGGVLSFLGFLGVWAVFSGTSASSPAWAAIIALLDQKNGGPVGFINSAIYSLAASGKSSDAFHDITQGENSDTAGQLGVDGFAAGKGYDLTTGWGTPDVAHFIQDIGKFLHGDDGGDDGGD